MAHIFDYTFLKYSALSYDFVDLIGEIKERNAIERVRRKKFAETFDILEQKATVASVVASNAIEGINTTEGRAVEIVRYGANPLTHDELEIAGYRDALGLVHGQYNDLSVSEATILRLHSEIYKFTNKTKGCYKQTENAIYSQDRWGNRELVFSPESVRDTPQAMVNLIAALREAQAEQISPLLLAPCFILDFLCIHPFGDGNGRVSRLLSLLLLYKNGFDAGRFISFDGYINKRRDGYYAALGACSREWRREPVYEPFMLFFLNALYACYEELADKFVGVAEDRENKKERVRLLVTASLAPISKKEIADRLPDISAVTITNVLIDLEKKGVIKKVGAGRLTKYIRR